MNQDIRKCQKEEDFFNCTTNKYFEKYLKECGCLPMNIAFSTSTTTVTFKNMKLNELNINFRTPVALQGS